MWRIDSFSVLLPKSSFTVGTEARQKLFDLFKKGKVLFCPHITQKARGSKEFL